MFPFPFFPVSDTSTKLRMKGTSSFSAGKASAEYHNYKRQLPSISDFPSHEAVKDRNVRRHHRIPSELGFSDQASRSRILQRVNEPLTAFLAQAERLKKSKLSSARCPMSFHGKQSERNTRGKSTKGIHAHFL